MKKFWVTAALAALALQLAVPLAMIWKKERVIVKGEIVYFRSQPVDPYDPFRGRFVTLSISDDAKWTDKVPKSKRVSGKVWVRFTKDKDGMMEAIEARRSKTDAEGVWLRIPFEGSVDKNENVSIDLPFNRFYMEEKSAIEADKHLAGWRNRNNHKSVAVVRVLDGEAVLTDVLVDGQPIREFVKAKRAEK